LDSICNYFISRTTSGVMEGINNRLKLIKRQAYGFVALLSIVGKWYNRDTVNRR
jgi:hypothetical protein